LCLFLKAAIWAIATKVKYYAERSLTYIIHQLYHLVISVVKIHGAKKMQYFSEVYSGPYCDRHYMNSIVF